MRKVNSKVVDLLDLLIQANLNHDKIVHAYNEKETPNALLEK